MLFKSFYLYILIFALVNLSLCSQPNVGFLYEKNPSNPTLETLGQTILNDFINQIASRTYTESPVILNSSTLKNGFDLSTALDEFERNNVKHIFSPILFDNFTLINQKLSDYGMVMWSASLQPLDACHSNIIYYGSIRKAFEQCIYKIVIL